MLLKRRKSMADMNRLLEEEKSITASIIEERNALRDVVDDLWQQLKATRQKLSARSDAMSKQQRALIKAIRNLAHLTKVKKASHAIFAQPRCKPLLSTIWLGLPISDLIGKVSLVCRAWRDNLAHGTRFWKAFVKNNSRWTTSTQERGQIWQRLSRRSADSGISDQAFTELMEKVQSRQKLRDREVSVSALNHDLREVRRHQEGLLSRLLTEAGLSSGDRTYWASLQARESALQQQIEDLGGSNPFKPLSPSPRDDPESKLARAFVLIEGDASRTFSESRLRMYMQPELRSPSSQLHRIPRFRDKPTFIESLKRVLGAFCVLRMDIGYCQGMNFLAGLFLLFMDEREALRTLIAMMSDKRYGFSQIYKPGLVNVRMFFFQLDRIILSVLPDLHRRLQEEGIQVDMFASQWVMTMFISSESMPLAGLLRIWDLFLIDGWLPVLQLSACLLHRSKKKLLKLDFSSMLERLNRHLASDCRSANKVDEFVFFGRAVLGITRHMMAKLRREFEMSESLLAKNPSDSIPKKPPRPPSRASKPTSKPTGKPTTTSRPIRKSPISPKKSHIRSKKYDKSRPKPPDKPTPTRQENFFNRRGKQRPDPANQNPRGSNPRGDNRLPDSANQNPRGSNPRGDNRHRSRKQTSKSKDPPSRLVKAMLASPVF